MLKYIFAALLALAAACGKSADSLNMTGQTYDPLIVVRFRGIPRHPDIPWSVSESGEHISGCIFSGRSSEDGGSFVNVTEEAVEKGMLLAVISSWPPPVDLVTEEDDMRIWSDSNGALRTSPLQLSRQLPDSLELEKVSSQSAVLELLRMYKPEISYIELDVEDPAGIIEICSFWTSDEVISEYTVIVYCCSESHSNRGWCLIAGSEINGTDPVGVSPEDLMATVRLLSGLDWKDDLPESIPAVSVLNNRESIWRIME